MGRKIPVVILGSGNIGSDLLYKIKRNKKLETALFVGVDLKSEGLKRAAGLGVHTTSEGIDYFISRCPNSAEIILDATTAHAHAYHHKIAKMLNKPIIDLTPSSMGPYVIPSVNLDENIDKIDVNMVTCGGQATTPIVSAVSRITHVYYAEVVSTISSKSAGIGTRQNIDEFTRTTARALEQIGGADKGKAIIILNPAEPPITMRNTVYMEVDQADKDQIIGSIQKMVMDIKEYVPGYRLKVSPLIEGRRVTVILEVTGAGDFLPPYSGNLDIMTCAAVRVAERIADRMLEGRKKNETRCIIN